jgi:branched-subunit amino acid transport protein
MIDPAKLWTIIILLAIGTYLIRFSFLGLIGGRELPAWVMRHLNYVGVAVMPGLIAPMLVWPEATGGALDAPRLLAALAAFSIGIWRRSALWAVIAGFGTLYVMLFLVG